MLKINPLRRYDSIDGNAAIRDSFALIPLGNDFKELLTTHNLVMLNILIHHYQNYHNLK